MSTGRKADAGKPRWSLLPTRAVLEVVHVLTHGAAKYAPDNWKSVATERYVDALGRHVAAWQMGEQDDPESGRHHLAHAACCLLFILWRELTGTPEPAEDEQDSYSDTLGPQS